MQKLKAIITGSKVHDVGYRVMLTNKALSSGVNNFNTFNTFLNSTQAVIAIIEGDDETIEEYKNHVNNFFPEKSIVENISFEAYKNTVPPIERVMQAFQMEQWGKAIPILLDMKGTQDKMLDKQDQMLDKQDQMLDKQDQMLGKQDQMLDKQDLHIEITRNGFNDLKDEIKEMRSDMNAGFTGIKEEIHMQRDDFKEVFMKEVCELHNEINEIRATLARIQQAQEA